MYFSENSLAQLAAEYQAIEGMYHRLLMTYVALPLKNARAREFASQGFPRRLKIMVRCTRACLQLRKLFTRTDQNQTRNAVLRWVSKSAVD